MAKQDARSRGKDALFQSVVDSKKVLLPPLHIKLGSMMQFVKALPKDGNTFKYLARNFPRLSQAKLKEARFSSVLTLENSWETKSFKPKWKKLRDPLGNPIKML